jgi:hypothetical protein
MNSPQGTARSLRSVTSQTMQYLVHRHINNSVNVSNTQFRSVLSATVCLYILNSLLLSGRYTLLQGVSCFIWLVAGFSVCKWQFDARPVHVRFTAEKVTLIKVLIPAHADFPYYNHSTKKNNNKKLYTVLPHLGVLTFCTCCKILICLVYIVDSFKFSCV